MIADRTRVLGAGHPDTARIDPLLIRTTLFALEALAQPQARE